MTTRETPEERFRRVAERRTNAVLRNLRLLGNCANRRVYRYSEDEVKSIFSAIDKQLRDCRASFQSGSKDTRFRL